LFLRPTFRLQQGDGLNVRFWLGRFRLCRILLFLLGRGCFLLRFALGGLRRGHVEGLAGHFEQPAVGLLLHRPASAAAQQH
jgi:hypothetical protein